MELMEGDIEPPREGEGEPIPPQVEDLPEEPREGEGERITPPQVEDLPEEQMEGEGELPLPEEPREEEGDPFAPLAPPLSPPLETDPVPLLKVSTRELYTKVKESCGGDGSTSFFAGTRLVYNHWLKDITSVPVSYTCCILYTVCIYCILYLLRLQKAARIVSSER